MKKKILHVNSFNVGSTGNIMLSIAQMADKMNYDSYISYPSSRTNKLKNFDKSIVIGNKINRNIHRGLSYITGMNECYSKKATEVFLKEVARISPDIIHLHNLHSCYINLECLFNYIKRENIAVVWTLHDCWAFTGKCPHYSRIDCMKWKTNCYDCPQMGSYPKALRDKTKELFFLKKKWFVGVENLTIVTPSKWLADQVKHSFLKDYPIRVINNGINLDIFRPRQNRFRESYKIKDKIIILGVAGVWSIEKGIDVFTELSSKLSNRFKIVIVGVTDDQMNSLPDNIIKIGKTTSSEELAEIYTCANMFLNPTREDTFPTTNLEAMACGIPIVTYNTGGSVEVINKYTGKIIKSNQIEELISAIYLLSNQKKSKYFKERLIEAKRYNRKKMQMKYINLYSEII